MTDFVLFAIPLATDAKGREVFAGGDSVAQFASTPGFVSVLTFNGKQLVQKQRLTPTNDTVSKYGNSIAVDPSGKVLAVGGFYGIYDTTRPVDIYKKKGQQWSVVQTIEVPKYPGRFFFGGLALSQVGREMLADCVSHHVDEPDRLQSLHLFPPLERTEREGPCSWLGRQRLLCLPARRQRAVRADSGTRPPDCRRH